MVEDAESEGGVRRSRKSRSQEEQEEEGGGEVARIMKRHSAVLIWTPCREKSLLKIKSKIYLISYHKEEDAPGRGRGCSGSRRGYRGVRLGEQKCVL